MQVNNQLALQAVQALRLGKQVELANFVGEVADFCIANENGRVMNEWSRSQICDLVAYHLAKDTLIIARDDGKVSGVAMWYHCEPGDGWDFISKWSPDKPDGGALLLAFLFAKTNKALREIGFKFIEMEPEFLVKKLLGIRHRSNKPQDVEYTPAIFTRMLKIKEQHG